MLVLEMWKSGHQSLSPFLKSQVALPQLWHLATIKKKDAQIFFSCSFSSLDLSLGRHGNLLHFWSLIEIVCSSSVKEVAPGVEWWGLYGSSDSMAGVV